MNSRQNSRRSLLVIFALGTALSLGTRAASAQATYDASYATTDLSQADAWIPDGLPGPTDNVVFNSAVIATAPNDLTNFYSTESNTTWGSITSETYNSFPVYGNAFTSTVISLTGSTAVSTPGDWLVLGNLNLNPASGSSTTLDLTDRLSITGALGTAVGNATTVTVTGGGDLSLNGSSNAGNQATTGVLNMVFENNSKLVFANDGTETFGSLTINNDKTNLTFASMDTKTPETFTGALTIASGAELFIRGWQGNLGMSGTQGQLFFANVGQSLGTELNSVVFELATNLAGPTATTYDPTDGANYDYGEWITDPNNTALDELVPYAAVPEPTTILAGLILVGVVARRERQRVARMFTLATRAA